MTAPEEWRSIPEYVGFYEASSHGRIRSLARYVSVHSGGQRLSPGKVLTASIVRGYGRVSLSKEGIIRKYAAHILVCLTFHGARPDGADAAHTDGDSLNNWSVNLRWATRAENMADARRHGTLATGERQGIARLTGADIAAIRARPLVHPADLSAEYGVVKSHIWNILANKRWHDPNYTPPPRYTGSGRT